MHLIDILRNSWSLPHARWTPISIFTVLSYLGNIHTRMDYDVRFPTTIVVDFSIGILRTKSAFML